MNSRKSATMEQVGISWSFKIINIRNDKGVMADIFFQNSIFHAISFRPKPGQITQALSKKYTFSYDNGLD